jgi:fucose permease
MVIAGVASVGLSVLFGFIVHSMTARAIFEILLAIALLSLVVVLFRRMQTETEAWRRENED